MPTFDFQCKACGNVFEFARAFGSKTLPACPSCGAKKTEKLLTPPAVHFKGTGWYKTENGAKPAMAKTAPKTDISASEKQEAKKQDSPSDLNQKPKPPSPPAKN